MSFFTPETWRPFTKAELSAYYANFGKQRSGKRPIPTGGHADTGADIARDILILQSRVSPFDVYTYLKARFGEPNGFQTFLASDDSDNLFHWDYLLKAGDQTITFTGATQEVHVQTSLQMSDPDWHKFIVALKADFARVSVPKGIITNSLEKWYLFPNRFLVVADRCADLYHMLSTSLPRVQKVLLDDALKPGHPDFKRRSRLKTKILHDVTTASTELPLLMPVMFESFIGLLVGTLTKPEVKANARMFEAFKRSALDVKLFDLATRCNGFARPLLPNNPIFKRYWTIVNRRNDLIHGNIDPVRDATEIVYFDKKRPLYQTGGDRLRHYWKSLIDQYRPEGVQADYITTHEFIIEIVDHLEPNLREMMFAILSDTQPGWDNDRSKLGKLFSNTIGNAYWGGLRYDSDLTPM